MNRAARLLVLSRALAKKGQEKAGSIKLTWAKRLLKEAPIEKKRLLREASVQTGAC